MLEGIEEKRDIPFTLRNVSFTDEYEGDFSTRRFIQYDLDFVAKTYFYQEIPTDEGGIIKKVQVDYSTAIRAPREQRYTVIPQAVKDYNDDATTKLSTNLDDKKTLVKVNSADNIAARNYIQINNETMYVREVDGTNLVVRRGQYGTKITEHYADDIVNLVNITDNALIEVGDDFGFSESSTFFGNDGLQRSSSLGTDI